MSHLIRKDMLNEYHVSAGSFFISYHSMSKFSKRQIDIFFIFAWKQAGISGVNLHEISKHIFCE